MSSDNEFSKKQKSNHRWKIFFILLLIVNVIYVSWLVVFIREQQTGRQLADLTGVAVFLYLLRLAAIDLIALLFYVFRRLPHSPAKVISYASVLIFLGPIFIYVVGGDLGIQGVYKAIRDIPLSREEVITHINNCRVKEIRRLSLKADQLSQIRLEKEDRNIANSDFDALRDAALATKNHCGHIEIKDYTVGYGYQVKDSRVYYNGLLIEEADYKTFEYVGDGYAKDATHVYYYGIISNADPASCTAQHLAGCSSHEALPF